MIILQLVEDELKSLLKYHPSKRALIFEAVGKTSSA